MKQFRPTLTFCALLPLLLGVGASVSHAQPPSDDFGGGPLFDDGPDGHRPPPPGRGGPRGGGPKGHLDGLWHGVERMQSGPNALSKAQAQKIVALVKPWTNRASMSDANAEKLVGNIEAVLTRAQKSRVGPPGRGGPPRGGGGRGGRGRGGFGPPPPRDGGDFGPPPPRDGGDDFGPPPPRDGGDDFGPPPPRDGEDDFGPPPPRDGEFGPPPGRGGGGPNGRRRGGGHMFPASYNPFYAPTGRSDWKTLPTSTQQVMARRYREVRTVLESLSRSSKS